MLVPVIGTVKNILPDALDTVIGQLGIVAAFRGSKTADFIVSAIPSQIDGGRVVFSTNRVLFAYGGATGRFLVVVDSRDLDAVYYFQRGSDMSFFQTLTPDSDMFSMYEHVRSKSPIQTGVTQMQETAQAVYNQQVAPAFSNLQGQVNQTVSSLQGQVSQTFSSLQGQVNQAVSSLQGQVSQTASSLQGQVNQAVSIGQTAANDAWNYSKTLGIVMSCLAVGFAVVVCLILNGQAANHRASCAMFTELNGRTNEIKTALDDTRSDVHRFKGLVSSHSSQLVSHDSKLSDLGAQIHVTDSKIGELDSGFRVSSVKIDNMERAIYEIGTNMNLMWQYIVSREPREIAAHAFDPKQGRIDSKPFVPRRKPNKRALVAPASHGKWAPSDENVDGVSLDHSFSGQSRVLEKHTYEATVGWWVLTFLWIAVWVCGALVACCFLERCVVCCFRA